jgi:hypothetical protein
MRAKGLSAYGGGGRKPFQAADPGKDGKRNCHHEPNSKPVKVGEYVGKHLIFRLHREGCWGKCHSRQPDSGNPTVRDEKGGLWKREPRESD